MVAASKKGIAVQQELSLEQYAVVFDTVSWGPAKGGVPLHIVPATSAVMATRHTIANGGGR